MQVRMTRGTCLGGVDNDAHPGEVRNLPDAQALALIAANRAVEVVEPIEAEKPKRKQNAH
jgi:hypothetical protein